jgi:hypothetical protein
MNSPKPIKLKKCIVCKQEFPPFRSMQKVCSPNCAVKAAQTIRAKQERKELREARERAKPRSKWLKEAQDVFNQFIRLRDQHMPCISCGRFHQGQWHAGHYRSVGSAPELRFVESNCHKQCAPCNNYLSGNIVAYRRTLLERIGEDGVAHLEGKHEPLKLTIEEIKQIKRRYQLLCKGLADSSQTQTAAEPRE